MTILGFSDPVAAKHVEQGFKRAGVPVVLVWPHYDRRQGRWIPNDDMHPGEFTFWVAIKDGPYDAVR